MKQKTRGGKRPNSGRKPLAEKKEPVTVYLYPSEIDKLGGRDGVKHFLKLSALK